MSLKFFDKCLEVTEILRAEEENMKKAGQLIADAVGKGGIIQAFGSGHSYAAAIEICGRAGGFIPSKVISDPAGGMYESVEGVGKILSHKVRLDPEDIVVLISNSGRNPMIIELAEWVKTRGNKLIVVTALKVSSASTSRHSNGKLLYEYADVVLDNHSEFGDAALSVDSLDTKICGTSSFSAVLLLQQSIYFAVESLVADGVVPPLYRSANIDDGPEYNEVLENQYADKIFHI